MSYIIEHTGVTVTDLNHSIEWYKHYLGCEEVKRFSKPELGVKEGALIKLGESYLELIEPEHPRPAILNNVSLEILLQKKGINHLAIAVDDIKSVYNSYKLGYVELVTALIDERMFFCRDPDGTLLEIRQKK